MQRELVFPIPYFQKLLQWLAEAPDRPCFCEVGHHRLESKIRYLARGIDRHPGNDAQDSIRILLTMDTEHLTHLRVPANRFGQLTLGGGSAQGQWRGRIRTSSGDVEPLDSILLVGPGMHRLRAADVQEETAVIPVQKVYERFSRTIGAWGVRTWQRLALLPIAIVGCGRTGSIVATTLASLGIHALTLVDPDILELHNVAEMSGVRDSDVGHPKVEALTAFLQSHADPALPLQVTAIQETITKAYRQAITADVLFCCVDNDAARLACGILATCFHKVLVDIGTGVFHEHRELTRGADVRLVLPGDRCLRCMGSVANYDQGLKTLGAGKATGEREPWWLQRDGSLRALNMTAAGLAIQLLGDLVAGRVRNSCWIRLEFDPTGQPRVRSMVSSEMRLEQCPLCTKSGAGEAGVLWK